MFIKYRLAALLFAAALVSIYFGLTGKEFAVAGSGGSSSGGHCAASNSHCHGD